MESPSSVDLSNIRIFVTFFSGTVRPRRLKLGTHVGSGQMYHVYWNHMLLLIRPFVFSFSFLSSIQHWNFSSHFSREFWGLEGWHLVHAWTVGRCIMCTRIRLLLLIHPFISSFFFLSNFQHWNFSSLFSQELWGPEDWTWYTHRQWADVSCITESGCCCYLFVRLLAHLSRQAHKVRL